jgi:hypothetical protein
MVTVNFYILRNFLSFFLLLVLLNSFLIIDPELIIFFSISLVIILSINGLSETFEKFFNVQFLNYYYSYVKFFNVQLLLLHELSRFMHLDLFINFIPFYIEYYNNFIIFIKNFYSFSFKKAISLLNLYYFKLIRFTRSRLIKFYMNYYFLVLDQINYLFPRFKINNLLRLFNYYFYNIERLDIKNTKVHTYNLTGLQVLIKYYYYNFSPESFHMQEFINTYSLVSEIIEDYVARVKKERKEKEKRILINGEVEIEKRREKNKQVSFLAKFFKYFKYD